MFGGNAQHTNTAPRAGPACTTKARLAFNTTQVSSSYLPGTPALAADGTLYHVNGGYSLYALTDSVSGLLSTKWTYTPGANAVLMYSPALSGDCTTLYANVLNVTTGTGALVALNVVSNPAAPTLLWTYTLPLGESITGAPMYTSDVFGYAPTVAADGTIYIGSNDDLLYAIRPNGTLKWTFMGSQYAGFYSIPAIGIDGTVYMGNADGYLYAVYPNGAQRWSFLTGMWVNAQALVTPDGSVYFGSFDEYLYALNADGTQKWSYFTGIAPDAYGAYVGNEMYINGPVMGASGVVYFPVDSGRVYAFM